SPRGKALTGTHARACANQSAKVPRTGHPPLPPLGAGKMRCVATPQHPPRRIPWGVTSDRPPASFVETRPRRACGHGSTDNVTCATALRRRERSFSKNNLGSVFGFSRDIDISLLRDHSAERPADRQGDWAVSRRRSVCAPDRWSLSSIAEGLRTQ